MTFWNYGKISNINEGSQPNDGTGDSIRDAFNKVDDNFSNISIQLGSVNQDWLNANIQYNFQASYANIANSFVANSTGVTSNFSGNTSSANIIANVGLYSSTVSYLKGNTYVSGNIIPTGVGTYNLGTSTMPFGNLYVQNTVSTNQISQSTDAGILKIHANAFVGDLQDTGILGNISSDYPSNGNIYCFFGHQYTTNNFIYKITDKDTTSGNNIVVGGIYGNLQFGSGLFSNTTISTSTTTGALIVGGGVGIGGALNITGNISSATGNIVVGGNIYSGNYPVLTTNSPGIGTIYNGASSIFLGNTVFPGSTLSTSYSTGTIVVPNGGIGVYGNVVAGGLVGSMYGTIQTAAQPNITSIGLLTSLNVGTVSATSVGVTALTVTGSITATGIALTGLANIATTTLYTSGNTIVNNVNSSGNVQAGYFLGNGSVLTGIATSPQLQTLSANVGAYQIADSANVGTVVNSLQTLNANVGAYEAWANIQLSGGPTQTLSANLGAYQIATNANLGTYQGTTNTQTNSINAINANIGAYQIATNANLGTATTNITTLFANASTQATQITSLYTSANSNTVAYFGLNAITTVGLTVPSITHSGTSGTGDIGGSGSAFGTVWATATSAKYADVAEIYSTDVHYEPGTVVIFGGTHEITVTTVFADSRVAGAISTNPAYLMNNEAEGLPVALRGRVPVKVIGPVAKGDLLVTSADAGYAVSVGLDKSQGVAIFAKSLTTDLSAGIKIIEAVII